MYVVVVLDLETDSITVKCEVPSKDVFENSYIPKNYPEAVRLDESRYKISDSQCVVCMEKELTNTGLALSLIVSILTMVFVSAVICIPMPSDLLLIRGLIGGVLASLGCALISVIHSKCLNFKI